MTSADGAAGELRVDEPGQSNSYLATYRGVPDAEITLTATLTTKDLLIRQEVDGVEYVLDICGFGPGATYFGREVRCGSSSCGAPYEVLVAPAAPPGEDPSRFGLTLLGELAWPGLPLGGRDVKVVGNIAYLTSSQGLWVVDVSDPSNPVEVATIEATVFTYFESDPQTQRTAAWNKLEIIEHGMSRFALIHSENRGVEILDITDLSNVLRPGTGEFVNNLVGLFGGEARSNVFALDGTRVYVEDHMVFSANSPGPALRVWDLGDPANPVELGKYPKVEPLIQSVVARGDRAYVSHDGNIEVLDVTNPEAITVVDTIEGTLGARQNPAPATLHMLAGRTVGVFEDRAVNLTEDVGFGLDLGVLPQSFRLEAGGRFGWADRVIGANHRDGARVFDLSTPESPVELGHYQTLGAASLTPYDGAVAVDVDPATGRVYLVDYQRGFVILQLE